MIIGAYVLYIEPGESYDEYLEQLVVNSSNFAAAANDGYSCTQNVNQQSEADNNDIDHESSVSSVSGYSMQSSVSSSSDSSSIAPPAEAPKAPTPPPAAPKSSTPSPAEPEEEQEQDQQGQDPAQSSSSRVARDSYESMGYVTKISHKHLYKGQVTKVAVGIEGSNHYDTANNNNSKGINITSKVAADPYIYNINYGYNQTNLYNASYPTYGEISNSRVAQPSMSHIQFIFCRT